MVTFIHIIDIGPVGHNHAVPVESLLEPHGEQLVVGVHGDAIVHSRVHHERECSCLYRFAEGFEVSLLHLAVGHVARCAVLAAHGHSVGHIVLQTRCYMLPVDVVRVAALKSAYGSCSHLTIEVHILAVALPLTAP